MAEGSVSLKKTDPDKERKEALLETARKRFAEAAEGWRDVFDEARKDLAFLAGDQWDPKTKLDRETANRPALVINKLPTFWQQVANEARQNKPAVRVSPIGGGATEDLAKVLQGIVRHIEYASDADVAYNTAYELAVGCGIGYYRIRSDYVDERSFDQELHIDAIEDPFSVYLDPHAVKADRSDARWAFIVREFSREEYEQRWGDSETAQTNFFADGLPYHQDWIGRESVRVAEYYYIETERKKLLHLSTGATVYEDEIGSVPAPLKVIDERWVEVDRVKCAVLNGAEVLEESDWDGKWIPIVSVTGKEIWIEGKRHIFSLVRFARDPQQLYNFYKTAQAEAVQVAPKSPWIGAEGQFKGHEKEWARANNVNYSYLEYKPVALNGQNCPPPQRNVWEPPIVALSQGAMEASDDIKATTGIFDPSLGAQARETSGIAIQRRQHESDVSNFHFLDNLARAQRFGGRQLIDLIPKRYDTAREARIIGEDEQDRVITVNKKYIDETGAEQHYDLSLGRYDVAIESGPSYTTKRDEAFDFLSQLTQANPDLLMMAGDIMFQNSDVAGADQLADRLKQIIQQMHPNLQIGDQENPDKIPPQVAARMAALQGQLQMLTQEFQKAQQVIQTKQVENSSRERIAAMMAGSQERIGALRAHAALLAAEVQGKSSAANTMLQAQLQTIENQCSAEFDQQQAAQDREQELATQASESVQQQQADAAQRQHEASLQASQQQHEAQQQAADRQHAVQLQEAQLRVQAAARQAQLRGQAAARQAQLRGQAAAREMQARAQKAKPAAKKPTKKAA
jgi:hypothetical protein